jgi:murein L,D-transpeptidase YafK
MKTSLINRRLYLLSLFFLSLLASSGLAAQSGTWLLVDTDSRELVVYQGERELSRFNGIAIGRGGAAENRQRGDHKTPLGEFRIGWINWDSEYHIFLGIDYPTFRHASRAYRAGYLELDDYLTVIDAVRMRRLPPQTTILGGHIGIHGLGKADPYIHQIADWTRGCIAMTDSQVEELAELVSIGTRVVIR